MRIRLTKKAIPQENPGLGVIHTKEDLEHFANTGKLSPADKKIFGFRVVFKRLRYLGHSYLIGAWTYFSVTYLFSYLFHDTLISLDSLLLMSLFIGAILLYIDYDE